jgi:hypothetical protein
MVFDAIAECGYGLKDTSNVNGKGSSIGAVKRIALEKLAHEYGDGIASDVAAKVIRSFGATAHKSQWFATTFEIPFTAYLQNNRQTIERLINPAPVQQNGRYTAPLDDVTGGGS